MSLDRTPYWVKGIFWGAVSGAGVGLVTSILSPQHWRDFVGAPLYVSWFMVPAEVLFLTIFLPIFAFFGIDFMGDYASVGLLEMTVRVSIALVFVLYGASLGLFVSWIGRKRHWFSHNRMRRIKGHQE